MSTTRQKPAGQASQSGTPAVIKTPATIKTGTTVTTLPVAANNTVAKENKPTPSSTKENNNGGKTTTQSVQPPISSKDGKAVPAPASKDVKPQQQAAQKPKETKKDKPQDKPAGKDKEPPKEITHKPTVVVATIVPKDKPPQIAVSANNPNNSNAGPRTNCVKNIDVRSTGAWGTKPTTNADNVKQTTTPSASTDDLVVEDVTQESTNTTVEDPAPIVKQTTPVPTPPRTPPPPPVPPKHTPAISFDQLVELKQLWTRALCPPSDETMNAVLQMIEEEPQARFFADVFPLVPDRNSLFGGSLVDARDFLSHQVANPFSKRRDDHDAQNIDEGDELCKILIGKLNKLSDTNYTTVAGEIFDLQIPEKCSIPREPGRETVLTSFVKVIYNKALSEKKWAHLYGRLCSDLTKLPETQHLTFGADFRKVLLNLCQAEYTHGIRLQSELQIIEDPEEREIQESLHRKRTLSNMKFVGELFKYTLITERIMHQVLHDLILSEQTTDDGVELFCELLETIGKLLEARPHGAEMLSVYFDQVARFAFSYPTPRIRFRLQNLIDLRNKGWGESQPTPTSTPLLKVGSNMSRSPSGSSWKSNTPPPQPDPSDLVTSSSQNSSTTPKQQGRRPKQPPQQQQQPQQPQPQQVPQARPIVSLTSLTSSQWEHKISTALDEELEDVVDDVKYMDAESRSLFVLHAIQVLCSSYNKYLGKRSSIGPIFEKLVKDGFTSPAEIRTSMLSLIRGWIDEDATSDNPKLWDCWSEIVSSLVTLNLAQPSIFDGVYETIIDTADEGLIETYLKSVEHHGHYLRALNCARKAEVLRTLVEKKIDDIGIRTYGMLLKREYTDIKADAANPNVLGLIFGAFATYILVEGKDANTSSSKSELKKLQPLFVKLVDAKSVEERAHHESLLLQEVHATSEVVGRSPDALIQFLLRGHIVSEESVRKTTSKKLLKDS